MHTVGRDVAAAVLGLSVRRFHELTAAGTLPAPTRHGRYDLRALARAYRIHRRGVPLPTLGEALARLMDARDLLEELVARRFAGQRLAPIEHAAAAFLLPPSLSENGPSRPLTLKDVRALPGALLAEVLGVSEAAVAVLVAERILPAPIQPE